MTLREYIAEVSVPVYLVVILFGVSSWIGINGVYVEVPLLVTVLPETWDLFSYMTLIIQCANIGPVAYALARRACPGKIREWTVVYAILAVAGTCFILLAFFWSRTTEINGGRHSSALFALTGFLALVACTSSVVYLPYMASYRPQYLSAYYIGEGLSGMLPGLVGLVQGVESEPNCLNQTVIVPNYTTGDNVTEFRISAEYPQPLFSVQIFFFFLFGMILVSAGAFSLLNFHPACKRERLDSAYGYSLDRELDTDTNTKSTYSQIPKKQAENDFTSPSHELESTTPSKTTTTTPPAADSSSDSASVLSSGEYVFLLLLTGWLNALLNGVIPATQSYTCLPYGSLAYNLAVRLSTVATPLVYFMALFAVTKSLKLVGVLSLVATALTIWHLYLAALSPFPPLKTAEAGAALVIVTQIVCGSCIAYVKVSNASILHNEGGPGALRWYGGVTQAGSCIGAILTFVAVNVLHVFHSEPPCP